MIRLQFYIAALFTCLPLWISMLPAQGWVRQLSGTSNNLLGVSFIDSLSGIVVGENGIILRTTNGGLQWISSASHTT